jgi:MFS transporter, DHA1 family, tetracycline resistance protein
MRSTQASVVFVLITVFIDVLGIGLVFPILPRLVQSLLGGDIGQASFMYGLLVSVYALMQFSLLGILLSAMARLTRSFGRTRCL